MGLFRSFQLSIECGRESDMESSRPMVIGRPFRPKSFPHRFRVPVGYDWAKLLSKVPKGWALRVPTSPRTVLRALTKLQKAGLIKQHEYVARRDRKGCMIFHAEWFAGEPFPLRSPWRRKSITSLRWDSVFRKVESGRTVTVQAKFMAVYNAVHRRVKLGEIAPNSIQYERFVKGGKQYVRLRRK